MQLTKYFEKNIFFWFLCTLKVVLGLLEVEMRKVGGGETFA